MPPFLSWWLPMLPLKLLMAGLPALAPEDNSGKWTEVRLRYRAPNMLTNCDRMCQVRGKTA